MNRLRVRRRRCGESEELMFRALLGPWERLRGLLGTDADAEPVALVGCSSVHTFGMRYPLDVAFVSREGVVLKTKRVWPGHVVRCPHGSYVVERPACCGSWLREGERVGLALLGQGRKVPDERVGE